MVEICPWNEVFTKYSESVNESLIILYWYLFNNPSYQRRIAEDMYELRESEEFKEKIPSYIAYENNIGNCIQKMEEHNLIGIERIENRKNIYQALSFFYLDPFCIKTPNSVKGDIESHYQEYKQNLLRDGTKIDSDWREYSEYIFNEQLNTSVMPAQKLIQQFSHSTKQFMKYLFSKNNRNYLCLYELIRSTFFKFEAFDREGWNMLHDCNILEIEEIIRKSGISEFHNQEFNETTDYMALERIWYEAGLEYGPNKSPTEKELQKTRWLEICLNNLINHVWEINENLELFIIPIYRQLELNQLYFNGETLQFEEY
ncbi:MAG: hypothetical protein PVF58_10365 [Candidatus Methanofastidiosia archaeon]|jgi:hypothetical protein